MCSKSYKTKSSYTYHLTSHLRTTKLFRCHLCKRQFVTPSSLSLHMRLHSGAAPLQCRFCPRKFTSSYKRQYHMEQVHLPAQMQARKDRQAELRKKRVQKLKAMRSDIEVSSFTKNEDIPADQDRTVVTDAQNNFESIQISELQAEPNHIRNKTNLTTSSLPQTKEMKIQEASVTSSQSVPPVVSLSRQYEVSSTSNYCPVIAASAINSQTSISTQSMNTTSSEPPIIESSEMEPVGIQESSYQFLNSQVVMQDHDEHNLWIRVPIVTANVEQEAEGGFLEPSLVAMTTDLSSFNQLSNVTILGNNQNVYINEVNPSNSFVDIGHNDNRISYDHGQVRYVNQQSVYGTEHSNYGIQSTSYGSFEVNLPLSQRFYPQESLNIYEIEMDGSDNATGPTPDQY